MSKYGALIQKAREEKNPPPVEIEAASRFEDIALDQIQLPKRQPRRFFDPGKMQDLIASVKAEGILEPLIVRPIGRRQYELVAGERRLRAARAADLKTVPVTIHVLDEKQAQRIALVENLQREDLNPVEETQATVQLLGLELEQDAEEVPSLLYRMQNAAKGKTTHNVMGSQEAQVVQALFEKLPMTWQSFVSNRLPLLKWPLDILDAIERGELDYSKAKLLAQIKDIEARQQLVSQTAAQSLSVSEVKSLTKAAKIEGNTLAETSSRVPELRQQIDSVYRALKKSKVWENPHKSTQIKKLLRSLESLLEDS